MPENHLVENPVYERNLSDEDLFKQTYQMLKDCHLKIENARKENRSIGSYGDWLIDLCVEISFLS